MAANANPRTSFFTALTETSSTDKEGVGTLRTDQFGNVYRWVKNEETSDVPVVGQAVFHLLSNGVTMTQTIQTCATADLGVMAGLVMATTLPALYYGWVQVIGYHATGVVSNATNVTITAGCFLKGVNAATYMLLDAATQASYKRNVQILEAVATAQTPAATTKKMYVNCL